MVYFLIQSFSLNKFTPMIDRVEVISRGVNAPADITLRLSIFFCLYRDKAQIFQCFLTLLGFKEYLTHYQIERAVSA